MSEMPAGSRRFAGKAAIPGISNVILPRCLREPEEPGLIRCQVIPASPVHAEYHSGSLAATGMVR